MGLVQRVLRVASKPSYILGRFQTVRRTYALSRGLTDPPPSAQVTSPLFSGVDVAAAVARIRADSYVMVPRLASGMVAAIRRHAESAELVGQGDLGRFRYHDITDGRLPDGRSAALAYVDAPAACPEVVAVRDDPVLNAVAGRYLGYTPRQLDIKLYWSLKADLTESERRGQNQTIDYHFDVHSYNFCYFHLYVTDTDDRNGAHVLVRGSHARKPVGWLFGSARRSDADVARVYPPGDVVLFTGPGGTGFIEDTSCYHKALAPVDSDRLLLQIRYY